MKVEPRDCVMFVPPTVSRKKHPLYNRIAKFIMDHGGITVYNDYGMLEKAAGGRVPIIGCTPAFAAAIKYWRAVRQPWIYWDRGYLRRMYSKWLPEGENGGYYRWHLNAYQMSRVREVPGDRWRALGLEASVQPWSRGGDKIVIADTLWEYWELRDLPRDWSRRLKLKLSYITKRPIVIRDKESDVPLQEELRGAHCLVTHGSIAAVEAVIMGCPVFVDPESAAAPVGQTDLGQIEAPIYPDREKWLWSLAYSQFTEEELGSPTVWRLSE